MVLELYVVTCNVFCIQFQFLPYVQKFVSVDMAPSTKCQVDSINMGRQCGICFIFPCFAVYQKVVNCTVCLQ